MNYRYDLIRSARKSVCVSVSAENKITVRCPWGMTLREIEKFLDLKSEWIEKVVLKNSRKLALNDDVLEFKRIYLNGETLPLIISDKNSIEDDAVYVKNTGQIANLYKKHCFAAFKSRVEELAQKSRLYPKEIFVRDYKGRWGCCDAKNNITFNYKLFMLPPRLQDYVIIHELCHTLCHNHSQAFWKLVSEFVPDYKERRKELQNFDFISTLY